MRQDLVNLSTAGGLLAILLWSTTFALARSLSEQVGPITAGTVVYLIAGCFCLARLALTGKRIIRHLKLPPRYLLGCGALFVFYTVALYFAVGLSKDREQLLEIALLNYLWPALTIVFSLPLLKKRASLWLVPGTALALTGVFMVMTQGASFSWTSWWVRVKYAPAVYLLALAAAISWALYSNLARRWSETAGDGAVELFIPITGIILLTLRFSVNEPTVWSAQVIGEALALGAITALGYVLWEMAMRKGNLLFVIACSYFTPLLSTIVSSLYLQVSPNHKLWIGCLLLVLGSLITWCSVREKVTV